jgi:hypothetical protein
VSLGTVASEKAKMSFARARVPSGVVPKRLSWLLLAGGLGWGSKSVNTGMLKASQNLTRRAACGTTALHRIYHRICHCTE